MSSSYRALLRAFGLATAIGLAYWMLGDVVRGAYSYAQDGLGGPEMPVAEPIR